MSSLVELAAVTSELLLSVCLLTVFSVFHGLFNTNCFMITKTGQFLQRSDVSSGLLY